MNTPQSQSAAVAHTPTPWEADGAWITTIGTKGMATQAIAHVQYTGNALTLWANAAFIVRAVNGHQSLVDALQAAQRALNAIPRTKLNGPEKDSYAVASIVDAALEAAK